MKPSYHHKQGDHLNATQRQDTFLCQSVAGGVQPADRLSTYFWLSGKEETKLILLI